MNTKPNLIQTGLLAAALPQAGYWRLEQETADGAAVTDGQVAVGLLGQQQQRHQWRGRA